MDNGSASKRRKIEEDKVEQVLPRIVLEDGKTSILANDNLLSIFSLLPLRDLLHARLVCHRWKSVVEKYFAGIKKFPRPGEPHVLFHNDVTVQSFPIMLAFAHNLTELNLIQHSYILSKDSFSRISNSFPNLEKITFARCLINDDDLKSLGSNCRQIKAATLHSCQKITDDGLRCFFQLLPELSYLDLTGCNFITGVCFDQEPSKLKSLFLNGNRQLSESGLAIIASHCRSLCELDLVNLTALNDEIFSNISLNCDTLQKLTVSCSKYLTPSAYSCIGRLNLLEHLVLANQGNVDNSAIIEITKHCPKLKIVSISGNNDVCDRGLQEFEKCENIEDLQVGYLQKITDASIIRITKSGSLQRLRLQGCVSITDASCLAILNSCPNLKHLDVSGCRLVTNNIVDSLLQAVQARTNNLCLTVVVGGTCFIESNVKVNHPLLKLDFMNYCNRRWM